MPWWRSSRPRVPAPSPTSTSPTAPGSAAPPSTATGPNKSICCWRPSEQVDLPFLEPAAGPLRERLRVDLRRLGDDLARPRHALDDRHPHRPRPAAKRHTANATNESSTAVANTQASARPGRRARRTRTRPDPEVLVSQLLGARSLPPTHRRTNRSPTTSSTSSPPPRSHPPWQMPHPAHDTPTAPTNTPQRRTP